MQDETKVAALISLLNFLAPAVNEATEDDKKMALNLAFGFRPTCLPEDKQDTAQVYYAGALLYGIQQQKKSSANGGITTGMLKREKEGDLEREYAVDADLNTGPGRDPFGYMDQFEKLNHICKRIGSITVGKHASCCTGPWGV